LLLLLTACQAGGPAILPTLVPAAIWPLPTSSGIPPTWTAEPVSADVGLAPAAEDVLAPAAEIALRLPTGTRPPLPTYTPTPTATPTLTPSPTPTATLTPTVAVRAFADYELNEPIPAELFPRPAGDNGWGIHWIPTISQDRGTVDRFVDEVSRMHIKWVVFLNEGSNIGNNDYLVERLVANGIMPVMRIYRSGIAPYDGDLGPMVAHYRARGVIYFQLYNEPNVNDENHQGFANPNLYATAWAAAARDVVNNGGLPGIGAFSPGGSYDHYTFLDRTLRILKYNGDAGLLNRAWLSVHNYHGLRPWDDPEGFFLYRRYDEIVRHHLQRSLPILGTEGGSYSPDAEVEKAHLIAQYSFMRQREPYFLAYSHWLLANQAGGSVDATWEWQALIRNDFVHPVITDFFYRFSR
jgi:hypothetical protein